MKVTPRLLGTAFGAYFGIVAAASWFTASGTTSAWFGEETSYWSYGMFLLTFLLILGLAPILGAIRNRANPTWSPVKGLGGPAAIAALFAGIAAAMLPGSSGFLQADFRLNTTLILTMSWSWFGLAFYRAGCSAVALRS